MTDFGETPDEVPEPLASSTGRELRAMARVAAYLRRRARRLPEDSPLRAELLETAEYFATAADEADVRLPPPPVRNRLAR